MKWVLLPAIALLPALAAAQTPKRAPEAEEEEIVVVGQRQRGSVVGDIPPELQLGPADVRALGVSSVSDLLTELGPQLRSGSGGPPVVLLEGRRIADFREVATLPSEAIARVDILPQEVALKYGYPADQKVVNIVLRQRFRAVTVEATDRIATAGGANRPEGEVGLLRIFRDGRLNIDAEYNQVAALTEAQRGVGTPDSAPFRTLIPSQQQFNLSASYNRKLGETAEATLSGQLQTNDRLSRFGLPGATLTLPDGGTLTRTFDTLDPLGRDANSITGSVGLTLAGTIDKYQWTATGNFARVDTNSFIDRGLDVSPYQAAILAGIVDPNAPIPARFVIARPGDRGRSVSNLGELDYTIVGAPFRLPAGEVNLTLRGSASFLGFSSSAVRAALATSGRVERSVAGAGFSVDLPMTSRRADVLVGIGDLSLNANFAARRLSDFGTLTTVGGGFTWRPSERGSLIGSLTRDEVAPTAQQLGDPVLADPNARVFDFVRGGSVFVTQLSGGNPALQASTRHATRLGLNVQPIAGTDLRLSADFTRTRVEDPITGLPPATLASQLAFPDRYLRDAGGNLVRIDTRTINLFETDRSELRWGINFSKPLKSSQATIDALRAAFRRANPGGRLLGAGEGARVEGRGPGGGGRGGFGGGGPGGGGRLNLALYHTWHLKDRAILRAGSPVIDLLDGGTVSGGGQPRHELEFQAGVAKNGLGARLTANFGSATRVFGGSGLASDSLRFSSLTTANLRLFANPAQIPSLIGKAPWLRGVRVTLGVDNIFDSRQRVTDASGATPLNYQPGTLDPLGRTVRIGIRKLFSPLPQGRQSSPAGGRG